LVDRLSKMSSRLPYSDQQEDAANHTEKSHSKRRNRKGKFLGLRIRFSRSRSSSRVPRPGKSPDPKNEEANNTQLIICANSAPPGFTPDGNKAVDLSNDNDMWTIAEKKLRQDPQKRKKLEKYDSILADHYGLNLKDVGTLERREQFLELLNSEIPKLDNIDSDSDSRLSRCSRKAKRCFKSAVGCVIASKGIITAATTPCLPAAVACAGVVVLLSVSLVITWGVSDTKYVPLVLCSSCRSAASSFRWLKCRFWLDSSHC